MKPRRTHTSNDVFKLDGANEDHDLWITRAVDGSKLPVLISVWVPTDDERQRLAQGENLELVVWGYQHPVVAMGITDAPLGRPPGGEPETGRMPGL